MGGNQVGCTGGGGYELEVAVGMMGHLFLEGRAKKCWGANWSIDDYSELEIVS